MQPAQTDAVATVVFDQRPERTRRPFHIRHRKALTGWAYAAPSALFVILLFLLPLGTVLVMSVSDWSLIGGNAGINFPENYIRFATDPLFWPAVGFTLLYTVVATGLVLLLALGLALFVQEASRVNTIVRTAILVPSALGIASAALLFVGLYSPNNGPISGIAQWLGLSDHPLSFVDTPQNAFWATVVLVVWRFTGFYMLVLLVGLQAIPTELYEAARLDGASPWQLFRQITIPLLRPSIALAVILGLTGSILAFDQFFILTRGGPDNSTITIVELIYRSAFQSFDLGQAGALSVVTLIALLALNAAQLKILRAKD
ncbi:MAG: sugar ABC transporter permease [Candidatus Saccharibacteria bacterium]|nr:sugar ABC transporter permease [Microbacteriaceae bacterium]